MQRRERRRDQRAQLALDLFGGNTRHNRVKVGVLIASIERKIGQHLPRERGQAPATDRDGRLLVREDGYHTSRIGYSRPQGVEL